MSANTVPAIEVETLQQQMQGGVAPFILDVREPHEAALCSIAGAVNIPLGQLPQRAQEIPQDRPIVAHCHHGSRSARATEWLLQNGFMNVMNLSGGIDVWAQRIEPKMERY